MRIWIDGQCLQTASRERGIGRYLVGLLGGIAKRPDISLEISFNAALPDALIAARDLVGAWIPTERIHVWHGMAEAGEASLGYTSRRQASEIALAHHVSRLSPDIALAPSLFEGFTDLAVPFVNGTVTDVASACIVYDFIPLHFPDRFLPTATLREAYERRVEALKGFPTALAISETTRRDLLGMDYAGQAVSISAGLDAAIIALSADRRAAPTFEDGRHSLLYVGGLDWHKNVSLIVDAIALLPEASRRGLTLTLAGSEYRPHQEALRLHAAKLGLDDGVLHFVGHVSDVRLAELFRSATALVHPSFMEGFGLTVLEAMQFGTPVICSTANSLVEVVADAGLMFSPHSARELADAIEAVLTRPELADSLRHKGFARAPNFSWDRSADLLAATLAKAIVPAAGAIEFSPDALRRLALDAIEPLALADDDVVALMALSEPSPAMPGRLIIDATSTLRSDARTGIQRVVKSICTEAIKLADTGALAPSLHVAFADDATGWYDVEIEDGFYGSEVVKSDERRLHIASGDVLVMLDSSWGFHRTHGLMAQRARRRGARVVSCLYDFVPLSTYAFCDSGMPIAFADWFGASLLYSDAYVCISKAVADELAELLAAIDFPRPIEIGYWHLGADFAPRSGNPEASPVERTASFRFLMVGTLEPRKGYDVALAAATLAWDIGGDFELVLVGKAGWKNGDFIDRLKRHPEFGRRLHWFPRVDDDELQGLYASCDALIASSYAEGFGLPLVEARVFGKPVIASDIPVFREVATAGTATFFPVGSSAGLADALANFMRRPKAETGTDAGQWLSWRASAEELTRTVLGHEWYKSHRPHHASYRPLESALDLVRMTSAIEFRDRKCHLELVSGPAPIEGGRFVRYIVKATNMSDRVWAGRGNGDGRFGVKLSYLPVTTGGTTTMPDDPQRTPIPFAFYPGQTHYMPLEVSTAHFDESVEAVDIQMVQEGVAWWGSPLRVPLR